MGLSLAKLEDEYFVQKVKLGQGSFGTVWRGVHKGTGENVAIKELSKNSSSAGRRREDHEKEIQMMKSVPHENLLRVHAAFQDSHNVYIVVDYCDGGDLGDLLKVGKQSPQKIAQLMRQLCSALCALHSASIMHRDVKPDNFMIAGSVLKLSDFGLACVVKPGTLCKDKCGTPAFMAPELHALPKGRGYSIAVDVWGAGAIFYMLLKGGLHPFLDSKGYLNMAKLYQGKSSKSNACLKPSLPGSHDFGNLKQLMCLMLDADQESRLTAKDVVEHRCLCV